MYRVKNDVLLYTDGVWGTYCVHN